MTENRRIFWNVVATYGRSLYALALGVFSGRWALMALGQVDYGLYGLVGGLTVFISLFNSVLAGANARFYAYSIGAAKAAEDKAAALDECRRWFNTAVSVHTAIPLALMAAGYPVGEYAIRNWLTIPPDRVADCVWVFRYACITCLAGMVSVPFAAMYTAKQYIAELTVYSFATSTLNVIGLYHMVTHPGVWLEKYAAWICAINAIPQAMICARALKIFPECKIVTGYLWDKARLKRLGAFSGWQCIGNLCGMLRTSGITLIVNYFFGAVMNAAQAIGNSVQAQCGGLAGAMQGAFTPVITQACGEGDREKMKRFAFRTCKFNVALTAVFSIPLALELPKILELWLKNPPPETMGLCLCALVLNFIASCTVGHMIVVNATGRVSGYYSVLGGISIFTLPLAVAAGFVWRNVYAMMAVVAVMEAVNSVGRTYFARRHAGMGIRAWVREIMAPGVFAIGVGVAAGFLPRLVMGESVVRVCATVVCCELAYLPMVWFFVFSEDEKALVREKVVAKLRLRR